MTSILILSLLDFYKEFVIETNASDLRVKVVLREAPNFLHKWSTIDQKSKQVSVQKWANGYCYGLPNKEALSSGTTFQGVN